MNELMESMNQPPLGVIEGVIDESVRGELEEAMRSLSVTGTIEGVLGSTNHFSIGTPLVFPVDSGQSADQRLIPPNLAGYEFYRVQLACTFEPAAHYRFHDATFSVSLLSDPAEPEAIGYDLYPLQALDERKISAKLGITPELKLDIKPVQTELNAKLLSAERGREYIVYSSRIQGFGLQTANVRWQFNRTDSHEISGSQPLFMVICKAPSTIVRLQFALQAQVELLLEFGPIGPIPLTTTFRRSGKVTEDLVTHVC
jgi:hypothetical protein